MVQALQASASPQVRNAATVGGNLLQRSRCPYFRGGAPACNRRAPGSGCAARDGEQRHAVLFGTSAQCIAAHASDLAVALLALDAQVAITGPQGERRVPLQALYPATASAEHEHTLAPGELVTAVEITPGPAARACGRLPTDSQRGDPDAALAASDIRLAFEFETSANHHQVLEPHASLALWQGDELTARALRERWAAGQRGTADQPLVAGVSTEPEAQPSYSACAFGAVFAEVGVHLMTREIRVRRIHAAYAAGRIVSPLMAHGQLVGGLVGGIGMLGTTGTAAAIANAVWHAIGRRVRQLPIRLERLL